MLKVIIGGSGSGKSEYAENAAYTTHKKSNTKKLIYIATMQPYGDEALARIKKHQRQRQNKGFTTIECYNNLQSLEISGSTILLECMSNLAANEMFNAKNENALADIITAVKMLSNKNNLVVVTNEIFSDGLSYDRQTLEYIKLLGEINCQMVNIADTAIEVVCGIPIILKE